MKCLGIASTKAFGARATVVTVPVADFAPRIRRASPRATARRRRSRATSTSFTLAGLDEEIDRGFRRTHDQDGVDCRDAERHCSQLAVPEVSATALSQPAGTTSANGRALSLCQARDTGHPSRPD
mgnify:CR=1 FL=1